MRVLLLGGGAREHALGWKLVQSPLVSELISAPGNPGLAGLGPVVEGIESTDAGAVAAFAADQQVDMVVVGPEAPLAAGVVDVLERRGIKAFGPRRSGARLESSKWFAKEVMRRAGVATAAAGVFHDEEGASAFLDRLDPPYVVKADGLASGKGVLVTDSRTEAGRWVRRCLEGAFGEAGRRVVVEEYLEGPEVSVFALCDGADALPLQPARDYKRLADGDTGPNTGGMGCFSPVNDLPERLVERTLDHVIRPVLDRMAADGDPYRGFLYAGLVLTERGPSVLEFNCRLGDPETQVLLPRLESDLTELIAAALDARVGGQTPVWSEQAAVDVVIAAEGYPDRPRKGDTILGAEEAAGLPGVLVFHAGTATTGRGLSVAGGRVLNVVGIGESVPAARTRAYDAVGRIRFPGMQFRRDIGGPPA